YFAFLGTSSVNTFLIKIPFLYTLNEYLSIPKAKRSRLSERSVSLSRISKDEVRSRSEALSIQKALKRKKAVAFLLRLSLMWSMKSHILTSGEPHLVRYYQSQIYGR
ncbi:hypothetical protein ACJ5M9_003542, partial [Vibrio campbellii]